SSGAARPPAFHNFAMPRIRLGADRGARHPRSQGGTMIGSRPHTGFGRWPAASACLAAALILLAGAAHGQQAPVEAQDQAAPQPKIAPPAEPNRPDLIDAFGHWIENSVTNWNSGLKDAAGAAGDAAKGAGNVVTDTAGAVARIPTSRVIAERAVCP